MKVQEESSKKKYWTQFKVLFLLAILGFIAVPAGVLAFWWVGAHDLQARPNISRNIKPDTSPDTSPNTSPDMQSVERTEPFVNPPNRVNIMLLGVDERTREGDPGRSDTLVMMTIDTVTREVSLLSVPRDTRVRIKGLGWDKINHAFMFGGVALTQQTVESFLGIPVDYYAKVDLESFGRVVDAIGGITINVEKRMQYEDTWDHFVIDLKSGIQRLDGRTALQYVRYRDEDGDIGRVRRQQNFMRAVLAEMNTPTIILKLPGIIREVFASLDTNMPMPMVLGLVHRLKEGLGVGFRTNMVEGLPYYINDISYWIPDVMKTRQKVAEMQGIPFSGNIRYAAQNKADEYWESLPAYARLDDGTPYSGMDRSQDEAKAVPPAQKTIKAPITVSEKPSAAVSTKPPETVSTKPPMTTPKIPRKNKASNR